MTAEIVELNTITTLDIPAERILRRALDADLDRVLVIGYDTEGNEYFASSVADGGFSLWVMERAKLKLLRMADEE
jgi:hypothetical protein